MLKIFGHICLDHDLVSHKILQNYGGHVLCLYTGHEMTPKCLCFIGTHM